VHEQVVKNSEIVAFLFSFHCYQLHTNDSLSDAELQLICLPEGYVMVLKLKNLIIGSN